MENRQLKTFMTIARLGNFTQAAETLGYAQSSVTNQIQQLEQELGVKLFERLGRRIALTREGEKLLPYAEQIIKLSAEARQMVSGDAVPKGTLTIGTVESLSVTRLPGLFEAYRQQYPEVEMVLHFGVCSENLRMLKTNEIDVTFILERKISSNEFQSEELVKEPMTVLAAPQHRLANYKIITPHDLNGESIIFTEEGCSYRTLLQSFLAAEQVQLKNSMEVNSIQAIKHFTASGLGVTLLPVSSAVQEIAEGHLVSIPWAGPDFNLSTQVVYHKDKWLSPALQSFLQMTRLMIRGNQQAS